MLLGLGGCVSCVSCAVLASDLGEQYASSNYSGSTDSPYDLEDDTSTTYTLDDILAAAGDLPGTVEGERRSSGVYEVGTDADMPAGRYFLEGSLTEESAYYLFEPTGDGSYELTVGVVYYGHYLTDLDEGTIIAFIGDDAARMYPESLAVVNASQPYQSGLYRVGTDIPAGTYLVAADETAAATASQDCAAYVMKDLLFADDSITDEKYVLPGSPRTITVQDGEFLELYAATATPAQ